MLIQVTGDQARAVLGALRRVAAARASLTPTDRRALAAFGRFVLRREPADDLEALPDPSPTQLAAVLEDTDARAHVVQFLVVMALVDGVVDGAKIPVEGVNERFATRHDTTHVLSGYDTTPQGELLVSTFTAGMHPHEPMSGHILPVIISWHLGIELRQA